MPDPIPVHVYARDPVSEMGISAQLRSCRRVRLVDRGAPEGAAVVVVISDEVDDDAVRAARTLSRSGERIVFVVARLDDAGMLSAVEAGASGLLRRSEATPDRLERAVEAAHAGEGEVPPDLLGRLLRQVGSLQRDVLAPRGLAFNGLTEREIRVLRLVAEGEDTSQIAQRLSYSERTIKNIVHDVTTRLNLRNRAHAVAYAVREGLI